MLVLVSVLAPLLRAAATDDLKLCESSDQTTQHDRTLAEYHGSKILLGHAPTYFSLMPARFLDLRRATRGLNCSGVPLVAFDGATYGPAAFSDDPGIYLLVPAVAVRAGLTPASAFDLVTVLVILLGIGIGFSGYWQICSSARARIVGAGAFGLLGLLQALAGDVYVFQAAPVIAGTPWLVLYSTRRDELKLAFASVLFALCAGSCMLVRSTGALPCMVFLCILVLSSLRFPKAVVVLLLSALFGVCPLLAERQVAKRRDAFLASVPGTIRHADPATMRDVWHSIYIGLGYWPNQEVPRYRDEVAIAKVKSVNPTAGFVSPEYDAVLKHEVWRILTHEPQIVLANVALKLAVISGMILLVTSLAIPSILKRKKSLGFDGAFLAAILASSLIGILVVPTPRYLLGMICFAALYALLSWAGFPRDASRSKRLSGALNDSLGVQRLAADR